MTTASGDGGTPLRHAAENGHLDIVKALIAARADVNKAAEDDGGTALLIASQFGHLDVVKALVAAPRADVDQVAYRGATPLYVAAHLKRRDIARLLLQRGVKVNKACKDGRTPLYAACEGGNAAAAGGSDR